MKKTCHQCAEGFEITDQDLEFYDKISPAFADKKFQIPTPTLCSECRNRARLTLRNPQKLWKRPCAKCENEMLTTYSPDSEAIVYCEDCYVKDIV